MSAEMIVTIGREALMTTLLVSAPLLIAALVIGLIISLFQAVTQINEMTMTFVPKIIAVAAALLIFLPWIVNRLTDFTQNLYQLIPGLGT